MPRMIILAFAAVALGGTFGGTGAMAQERMLQAQQSADQANAESQPAQGTAQVLATPGVEPKAYPLCSRSVQDECVNPREAGRNYGNRPLDTWPGRPASEMR